MEYLYHGSSRSGLTKLEPYPSTHGNYVYATPDRTLAILFSGTGANDFIYSLFRNHKEQPWQFVERIPGGFQTSFHCKSSIYTVDRNQFFNPQTGFSEFVSAHSVDIIQEERVDELYQALIDLDSQKKIQLYFYPNRPDSIPKEDDDLLEKCVQWIVEDHQKISPRGFRSLLFWHPKLLMKVNDKAKELEPSFVPITKKDLENNFYLFIFLQKIHFQKEYFLDSAFLQLEGCYPEIASRVKEKMEIWEKSREEQLNFIIDTLVEQIPSATKDFSLRAREKYRIDSRPILEIGQELFSVYNTMEKMTHPLLDPPSHEALSDSILLIGPRGAGKSTIARELRQITKMPNFSLDHREKWRELYLIEDLFSGQEAFRFFLTTYVLGQVREAVIVDFGAGHSHYKNPDRVRVFKEIITRFSNVILLLPSPDVEESLQILNERCGIDQEHANSKITWFHLTDPINQEIATDCIYTKNKSSQEVANEIIQKIAEKKRQD